MKTERRKTFEKERNIAKNHFRGNFIGKKREIIKDEPKEPLIDPKLTPIKPQIIPKKKSLFRKIISYFYKKNV